MIKASIQENPKVSHGIAFLFGFFIFFLNKHFISKSSSGFKCFPYDHIYIHSTWGKRLRNVVVCIRTAPQTPTLESLVTREWRYLKELKGLGVALMEEVCHQGWAWRFQKPKPGPGLLSSCCLWIQVQKELSPTSPAPSLPMYYHASKL